MEALAYLQAQCGWFNPTDHHHNERTQEQTIFPVQDLDTFS